MNKHQTMKHQTSRRDFIKKSTLAATVASLGALSCNMNNENKITSAGTPQERREQLYGLLCDLPPRDRKIDVKVESVERQNGYMLEKLLLDLNGQQQVPAWFALPENVKVPIPAVLFSIHTGEIISWERTN